MRRLKDPDGYSTPTEVAECLRDMARQIENREGMIRLSVQFSFATKEEVEEAYRRRS